MKFFTRFDPAPVRGLFFEKPSMTEQSHKDAVSIDKIINRYNRTGILGTPSQVRDMFYGDFSEIDSFHDAENAIAAARDKFSALPAKIRAEFSNDPHKLIAALHDETQLNKLIDLGIVKKPAPAVGTPDNPVVMQPSAEQIQQSEQLPT